MKTPNTGFSPRQRYCASITGALLLVLMPLMLALHLGAVLSFFLLTPFTKMAHGFYRLTALIRDARRKRLG